MSDQVIRVGIGVMIWKDGKVLIGKRKGSRGGGEFGFPGGAMDYGESFEECAHRETLEECGVEIQNLRFQMLKDVRLYPPTQWVHVGFVADWKSGEPTVLEPEKCEYWEWVDPEALPEPLFGPSRLIVEARKKGIVYEPDGL